MGWGAVAVLAPQKVSGRKARVRSCWVIPALTLPQVCLPLHGSTPAGPAPELSTLSPAAPHRDPERTGAPRPHPPVTTESFWLVTPG